MSESGKSLPRIGAAMVLAAGFCACARTPTTAGDMKAGGASAVAPAAPGHDSPLPASPAAGSQAATMEETTNHMISEKLRDFDKLWDHQDPAATELKFRELLPDAEACGDPTVHAELITQIARAEGLRGRYEQAQRTLESALPLLESAKPSARVRFLLERGRIYNSSGRKERARPFFLDAWDVAHKVGESALAIDAAHMMGIIEPPAEQLEWNLKALQMAEAATDPSAARWCGSLYNNIGWTYHDQGDFEAAMSYFEKALAFRQKHGPPRTVEIARWCIARCKRSMGRVGEALAEQQQLLEEFGDHDAGYTREEIGECLLLLGREDEARPWFRQAYERLSKDHWFAENEAARLARMAALGGVTPPPRDTE